MCVKGKSKVERSKINKCAGCKQPLLQLLVAVLVAVALRDAELLIVVVLGDALVTIAVVVGDVVH